MSLIDLTGKKGLVVGIANANSIAYGCATAFHAAGANLAITYLDARAESYVRPLAEKLASPIIVPCHGREAVFDRVRQDWRRLDFLLHSIASGTGRFDELLERAAAGAPTHDPVTIDDVGAVAACPVSDAACAMTGATAYVDGGYHSVG